MNSIFLYSKWSKPKRTKPGPNITTLVFAKGEVDELIFSLSTSLGPYRNKCAQNLETVSRLTN